jgi:hypothetical protein
VFFGASGPGTLANYGTISGVTGVYAGANGTVVNAGSIVSIDGAAGTAIRFGAGAGRLVVDPGAVFVGDVLGGSASSVLELAAGNGNAAGSIGAIGSAFVNFGTLAVDQAANWALQNGNSIGTVANDGTLTLDAGTTLAVTGAVDPASSGIFELDTDSILRIAADSGTGDRMQFLGSAELVVEHAAQFGIDVGTAVYAGPLIEDFGAACTIDLKDIGSAGATMDYNAATGLLQIDSGAGTASLLFDTTNLGSGVFHLGNDGSGHLMVTHF